jgi:hypothetical protein
VVLQNVDESGYEMWADLSTYKRQRQHRRGGLLKPEAPPQRPTLLIFVKKDFHDNFRFRRQNPMSCTDTEYGVKIGRSRELAESAYC